MRHEEIEAWVHAHRDDLPQDLAELSRFPIPFRKAIVKAVPAEVGVRLWREHLLSFIDSPSELEPEQVQLLRDAAEEIAVVFGDSAEAARASLQTLDERIQQLISRQVITPRQAREMFATLGPPEPPGGLPLPPDAHPTGAV